MKGAEKEGTTHAYYSNTLLLSRAPFIPKTGTKT
jgi:hypothetical protein